MGLMFRVTALYLRLPLRAAIMIVNDNVVTQLNRGVREFSVYFGSPPLYIRYTAALLRLIGQPLPLQTTLPS
jgi:hypothetical protein